LNARKVTVAFLLLLSLALVTELPRASAGCTLEIQSVDYPQNIAPGESFQIKTKVSATCTQTSETVIARVDIDDESGALLNSASSPVAAFGQMSATTITQTTGTAPIYGTASATVINTIQAPSTNGVWTITLVVSLWMAGGLLAQTSQSISIQIGFATTTQNIPVTQTEILSNGNFEQGLDSWQTLSQFIGTGAGGGTGSPSIAANAHSGSKSLQLNFEPSMPGGFQGTLSELIGVYQTVEIQQLRDLTVQAWFFMQQTGPVNARLRIQIGDLTVKYYVAQAQPDSSDNSRSRSFVLYDIEPYSPQWRTWLQINRNVAEDFKTAFGLNGEALFESNGQEQITVSLELIGFVPANPTPSFQSMLWDDVSALAGVPSTASTQTQTTQTTTTLGVTTSQSSLPASTATETSEIPATVSTQPSSQVIPSLTYTQFYETLAAIFGVALVVVAVLLVKTRSKLKSQPSEPKAT
jgi:hypothetical protein